MAIAVEGVRVPDSKLARELTEFVRDITAAVSSRVF
jgi:hypothetical protein